MLTLQPASWDLCWSQSDHPCGCNATSWACFAAFTSVITSNFYAGWITEKKMGHILGSDLLTGRWLRSCSAPPKSRHHLCYQCRFSPQFVWLTDIQPVWYCWQYDWKTFSPQREDAHGILKQCLGNILIKMKQLLFTSLADKMKKMHQLKSWSEKLPTVEEVPSCCNWSATISSLEELFHGWTTWGLCRQKKELLADTWFNSEGQLSMHQSYAYESIILCH